MDVNDAANYVQIADFTVPILVGLMALVGRRWLKRELEQMGVKVDERTRSIQKDANGGRSLPDVAKRLESIDGKIDKNLKSIDEKIDGLHARINEVGKDVSHLKGRFDQHIQETK